MAGLYTVTITNENGCTSVDKVTLRVTYTNKANAGSESFNDELSVRTVESGTVYPNPTADYIILQIYEFQ